MSEQDSTFNPNTAPPEVRRILGAVYRAHVYGNLPEGGIPAAEYDAEVAIVESGYTESYAQAAVEWASLEGHKDWLAEQEGQL
jgi:hypothetical protein